MNFKERFMSNLPRWVLALAVFPVGLAAAQTVPASVTFTARLADNGTPVQGPKQFLFKLFPTLAGGTEVWSESQMITVTEGDVNAELGASMPLSETVFAGARLYLEVSVDGTVLSPRTAVASVPYAMRSNAAAKVGTLGELDIQKRVSSTCPVNSSIRVIDAMGNVTCQSANVMMASDGGTSISAVFAGGGLSGGGTSGDVTLAVNFAGSGSASTAARSDHSHLGAYLPLGGTLACSGTEKVSSISSVTGSVTCTSDNNTTYSASSNGGLSLSGTGFGLQSCNSGYVLKSTGANSWGCSADADTLYSAQAGGGIALTGTQFGLINCGSGQVLKTIAGGGWTCAGDSDTTYSAGSGLALNGTQLSLAACSAGQILKSIGSGMWTCQADSGGASYTGSQGIDVTGTTIALATNGCGADSVWKRDALNGSWVCAPAVGFAGNGTATTASHSDHTHAYLALAGGALSGALSGTTAAFNGTVSAGRFDGPISSARLNVAWTPTGCTPAAGSAHIDCPCPGGTRATGGGCLGVAGTAVLATYPYGNTTGWSCDFNTTNGANRAWVICIESN
jgi:hypothetical protein